MKKKAIFTLVVFAAAWIAIATYSKMLPKIVFAKSAQTQEQASNPGTERPRQVQKR